MDKGFRNLSLTVHLPCSPLRLAYAVAYGTASFEFELLRNAYGGRLKVTQKLPQNFPKCLYPTTRIFRSGAIRVSLAPFARGHHASRPDRPRASALPGRRP